MRFVRFVEVWAVCMVLLLAGLLVGGLSCSHATAGGQAPAADDNHLSPAQRDVTSPRVLAADWPVAWTWYRTVNGLEQDLADLKAHGIQSIGGPGVRGGANAAQTLALARRFGMKLHIGIPEITENGNQVRAQGLEPQWAVMIGGCYRGRAIDRHLFAFTPEEHSIIIESPVYNQGLPYTTTVDGKTEGSGHYMTEARSQTMPLRAEVVVPLGRFDGRQHLQIVPATIEEAPPDSKLEIDSTEGLPGVSEIRNRHVYRVGFDLRGLPSGAMLDKVGIAVYWTYGSQVSARAESTRQAMRILTRGNLEPWSRNPVRR